MEHTMKTDITKYYFITKLYSIDILSPKIEFHNIYEGCPHFWITAY